MGQEEGNEENLMAMKHKVGDKVTIRKDLTVNEVHGGLVVTSGMAELAGREVVIRNICDDSYTIHEGKNFWNDEMFEQRNDSGSIDFPQDREENEYRYIEPGWLDDMARGLTAGAVKHPGETWRTIPSEEHAARAIRHLNMYLMGDRSEPHLVNASMRVMMAYATANKE